MQIDNTHPEALLPFYVNNTLNDVEQREIEPHIESCSHCQEEIRYLRAIQSQVKQTDAAPRPGDLGWQRLQRDIRKHNGSISSGAGSSGAGQRWWKPAMAAALLVIAVQFALIMNLPSPPGEYLPAGTQHEGIVVQLRFTDQATALQIHQIMRSVNGNIISGPSAIGLYRVQLYLDDQNSEQIEQRFKILAEQAVVDYVARE